MATLPIPQEKINRHFGPHLGYSTGLRLETDIEPDKIVKTHCCFCGMQCGIQLKVKDNHIIGFEPWEDFPFNHGMLCPKGVKRYMQSGHPDRLLTPLMRRQNGFQPTTWDESLNFTVAKIREIQDKYGKDAFAIYGGASLST